MSNTATVTIYVTGPAGPPVVGNDLFEMQHGRELSVAAPGVLTNDYSPNPRLGLTVELRTGCGEGHAAAAARRLVRLHAAPGYTGIDQFSYTVRDSEGRVSAEAHVGITITAGGPATATVGQTSPADGAVITSGRRRSPRRSSHRPGETVTEWTVSYRRPATPSSCRSPTGTGSAVAADFDPTLVAQRHLRDRRSAP